MRKNNELVIFNDTFFTKHPQKHIKSSTAADTFATPTSNFVYKCGMYLRMPGCDVNLIHR